MFCTLCLCQASDMIHLVQITPPPPSNLVPRGTKYGRML